MRLLLHASSFSRYRAGDPAHWYAVRPNRAEAPDKQTWQQTLSRLAAAVGCPEENRQGCRVSTRAHVDAAGRRWSWDAWGRAGGRRAMLCFVGGNGSNIFQMAMICSKLLTQFSRPDVALFAEETRLFPYWLPVDSLAAHGLTSRPIKPLIRLEWSCQLPVWQADNEFASQLANELASDELVSHSPGWLDLPAREVHWWWCGWRWWWWVGRGYGEESCE